MTTVGQRLTQLRKSKGVTQSQLADAIGITRDRYARYEIDNTQADYDTLVKLAAYHEVSVDFILGNFETRNPSKQQDFQEGEHDALLEIRRMLDNGEPITYKGKLLNSKQRKSLDATLDLILGDEEKEQK